ncbi:hypothetical protein GCM10010466_17240 [Planomonospora alba]|uniref:Uncharacterized protein n=1 Tax=Planomonospora alba TaxID=161354 RepID=A0ABP6MUZ1_9ACTN
MSNGSRSARGLLAVLLAAACAAGTATPPAAAAEPCPRRGDAAGAPGSGGRDTSCRPSRPPVVGRWAPDAPVAGHPPAPAARPRATGRSGTRASLPAPDLLAQATGLSGLSRASAVLSFADVGGVAGALGFPALPLGVPGYPGLVWVEFVYPIPDLPGLPSAPSPVVHPVAVPSVPPFANAAGVLTNGTVLALPAPMPPPRRATGRIVRGSTPPAATRQVPAAPRTEATEPPPERGQRRRLPILDGVLPDLPLDRALP